VCALAAAAATALNSVDCSSAPECISLYNRQICSTVKNTCGDCLLGFIGVNGQQNSVCIPSPSSTAAVRSFGSIVSEASPYSSDYGNLRRDRKSNILITRTWRYIDGSVCQANIQCFSGFCNRGLCAIGILFNIFSMIFSHYFVTNQE